MRILIIHRVQPFPPVNGGTLRAAYLASYLAEHYETTLLCFREKSTESEPGQDIRQKFAEFTTVPMPDMTPGITSWLRTEPGDVQRLSSKTMWGHVQRVMEDFRPDVLIAGDPGLSQYLLPYQEQVRILDYICVATLQFARLSEISTGVTRWAWDLRRRKYGAFHRRIAGIYDRCLLNSMEDKDELLATAPGWRGVQVVPNGLDLDLYPLDLAPVEPNTLVYPGATNYPPNYDAVKWFAEAILPRVREAVPEVKMYVTGRYPEDGSRIEAPGIEYTGFVDDVKPWISRATVCLVPLRAGGGGVRFKVLEAMALGTPMVSTAIGAEGVAYTDGVDILMAEDPETFADHVIQMLKNPGYRQRIADGGRRLIEEKYDWQRLAAGIASELEQLAAQKSTSQDG